MTTDAAATQTQDRVARWIEEGRNIFGLLAQLLEQAQRVAANSDVTERESERLRTEAAELRKELTELREEREQGRSEHGGLQKAMEQLLQENEQLRGEKQEAAQAFARLLETVQSTNQIAQKLGVTRSPFARHAPVPAPDAPPHD
jgi:chromosome segregation ATPase